MDRACGVRDRANPYVVERGPKPAAVAGGIGALGQCRAQAVRESAGCALEQERPSAPKQVRQFRGATAGRDRYPDPIDHHVRQLARQRAKVIGEHLDHVKYLADRDAGPDPVGHQAEQRRAAHHEVVVAGRSHEPDLASTAERRRV